MDKSVISYTHHTCEFRQHCYVENTAQQRRIGLFQDSDFAGDLEDSKSTSGGILCIFGSRTFVQIIWMCKKQNGIPALDLWHLVIEVFHSSPIQTNKTKHVGELQGKRSPRTPPNMRSQIQTKHINLDLPILITFHPVGL